MNLFAASGLDAGGGVADGLSAGANTPGPSHSTFGGDRSPFLKVYARLPTAPETTFDVCIGEHYFCDRHTSQYVRCGVNVENYIKAQCEKFEFTAPMEDRGDGPAGMCRYEVYHVKCTARR
jgi:hypothetical protein